MNEINTKKSKNKSLIAMLIAAILSAIIFFVGLGTESPSVMTLGIIAYIVFSFIGGFEGGNLGNFSEASGCASVILTPIYMFYALFGWVFFIVKVSRNSTEYSEIMIKYGLSESADLGDAIANQKEKINCLEEEYKKMKDRADSLK